MTRSIAIVLALAVAAGCRQPDRRSEADEALWQDVVIAELSNRAASRGWEFHRERVSLIADTSLAVPGLVYGWGVYVPHQVTDVIWFAAAAYTGGHTTPLASREDWRKVIQSTGWMPKDSVDAVQACGEMIQTTGERRGTGPARPIIYWDSTSLSEHPILAENLQLSRPEVEWNGSGGVTVRVWMVEAPNRTTRYECYLLPWEKVQFRIIKLQLGWGLPYF